jgi:hypothetical protein
MILVGKLQGDNLQGVIANTSVVVAWPSAVELTFVAVGRRPFVVVVAVGKQLVADRPFAVELGLVERTLAISMPVKHRQPKDKPMASFLAASNPAASNLPLFQASFAASTQASAQASTRPSLQVVECKWLWLWLFVEELQHFQEVSLLLDQHK